MLYGCIHICHSCQCIYEPAHNTGKISSFASHWFPDFLYQLTRSCCLSVFICLCLLVLSRSPSPLLLTSHLYPLKQTRCKGSQHCCANEKNAGFTLGFQHHICLNTVTLVNCNVMGDYVPLLSLSLSLRSPFSLCSFTPSSLLVVGIFWQLSHYTVKSILFACFHFTYSTCIVNNLTAKRRYTRLLARLLFISAFLQSWFF